MKPKKEKEMEDQRGWLYGWKEIASYVGCDVKTMQKYAIEYRPPIHRFPNGKIYAIPSEIDGWGRNFTKLS